MKCNRLAVFGWKSKAGMKYKPKVLGSFRWAETERLEFFKAQIKHLFDHTELCNGDIISDIELEYIPYTGGSDASVEVRFICNKCGHEFANENGLPYDLSSLNKFLTKVIEEM